MYCPSSVACGILFLFVSDSALEPAVGKIGKFEHIHVTTTFACRAVAERPLSSTTFLNPLISYIFSYVTEMFDAKRSGTIDINEFSQLYSNFNNWKEKCANLYFLLTYFYLT